MAHTINIHPSVSIEKDSSKKGGLRMVIVKFKAKRKAKKIMRSLNEAEKAHAGKTNAKSLDDFLDEL